MDYLHATDGHGTTLCSIQIPRPLQLGLARVIIMNLDDRFLRRLRHASHHLQLFILLYVRILPLIGVPLRHGRLKCAIHSPLRSE